MASVGATEGEDAGVSVGRLHCGKNNSLGESNGVNMKGGLPIFVTKDFSVYSKSRSLRLAVDQGFEDNDSRVAFLLDENGKGKGMLLCSALVKFKHCAAAYPLHEHEVFCHTSTGEFPVKKRFMVDEETYEHLDRVSKTFFPIVNKFVEYAVGLPNFREETAFQDPGAAGASGTSAVELPSSSIKGGLGFSVAPSCIGMKIHHLVNRRAHWFFKSFAKGKAAKYRKSKAQETSLIFDFVVGAIIADTAKPRWQLPWKKRQAPAIVKDEPHDFFSKFMDARESSYVLDSSENGKFKSDTFVWEQRGGPSTTADAAESILADFETYAKQRDGVGRRFVLTYEGWATGSFLPEFFKRFILQAEGATDGKYNASSFLAFGVSNSSSGKAHAAVCDTVNSHLSVLFGRDAPAQFVGQSNTTLKQNGIAVLRWLATEVSQQHMTKENTSFLKALIDLGIYDDMLEHALHCSEVLFGKRFDRHPGEKRLGGDERATLENASPEPVVVSPVDLDDAAEGVASTRPSSMPNLAPIFPEMCKNKFGYFFQFIQRNLASFEAPAVLNSTANIEIGASEAGKPPLHAPKASIGAGSSVIKSPLEHAIPTLQLSSLSQRRRESSEFNASGRSMGGAFLPLPSGGTSAPGTFSTRSGRRQLLRSQRSNQGNGGSRGALTPNQLDSPGQPSPTSPAAILATSRSSQADSLNNSTGGNASSSVMPALRLPLFRVNHNVVESVRTPFTPSTHTRRFITSRRHSNNIFGDPVFRLQDIATKSGEACVAKDLWALVDRRRRKRSSLSPLNSNVSEPIVQDDSSTDGAKAFNEELAALRLLLRFFSNTWRIGSSALDVIGPHRYKKVLSLAFFSSIGANKSSALRHIGGFQAVLTQCIGWRDYGELLKRRYGAIQKLTKARCAEYARAGASSPSLSPTVHEDSSQDTNAGTGAAPLPQSVNTGKAKRALKSLGFEHVLSLTILSHKLQHYQCSKQELSNFDDFLVSQPARRMMITYRDSVIEIYATLLATIEQELISTATDEYTHRSGGIIDTWIINLVAHPHANSFGALLTVLLVMLDKHIACNTNDGNKVGRDNCRWFVDHFVANEDFLWSIVTYINTLLQYSFQQDWPIGGTEEKSFRPGSLYKGYILTAVNYVRKAIEIIKARKYASEEKIATLAEIVARLFDPSYRVVLNWRQINLGKAEFLSVGNSLLQLESGMLTIPRNEFAITRNFTVAYIPYHYMSFMKLYNSKNMSGENIAACKRHLQILLDMVISSVRATTRRSPSEQSGTDGKKIESRNVDAMEEMLDEDHVMVWQDMSRVFFQTRLVSFFLRELSLESETNPRVALVDDNTDANVPLENPGNVDSPDKSMPAFKLSLPPKLALNKTRSSSSNSLGSVTGEGKGYADELESSFGSYDSEPDLEVENNFQSTAPSSGMISLLSLSLPPTAIKSDALPAQSAEGGDLASPLALTIPVSKLAEEEKGLAGLPKLSFASFSMGRGNDADVEAAESPGNIKSDRSVSLEDRRASIKLYNDNELHELIVLLVVRLAVDAEGGSLDPRYSPRIPMQEKNTPGGEAVREGAQNLPFILHAHLNHKLNEDVTVALSDSASSDVLGPGPERLLKLLCYRFYREKESSFQESIQHSSSLIASGAFGSVYGNHHVETNQRVAIKVVPLPKTISNRSAIVDVFSEVSALEVLHNVEDVVALVDFWVSPTCNAYCIAMKCHPKNLKMWRKGVENGNPEKGDLFYKCLEYFEKVILAVDAVHEMGVTHYDVKCDNILITDQGEVRLVDFGEASVRPGWNAQNVYNTRDRGTECIKSPEMLTVCHAEDTNRPQYDRRRKIGTNAASDVWSLGCLLYELLVGEFLFQDEDWTRFYCRLTGRGQQLIPDNARTALLDRFGSDGREILELLQTTMLVRNPTRRISTKDLLRYIQKRKKKGETQS